MAFDNFFTTWWPKDREEEWNQRRCRVYTIDTSLKKAREMRKLFSSVLDKAAVDVDDPEIVYNIRQAGDAKYIFFVNDHQINPISAELRRKRQQYSHFALMPMEFPEASTRVRVRGAGYLYPLLPSSGAPLELNEDPGASLDLKLDGGDGRIFLLLPKQILGMEFQSSPIRNEEGVEIKARVLGPAGPIEASVPVRIEMSCGEARQTVYAATENGVVSWTAPFLKTFPSGSVTVTVTDLASGKSVHGRTP